MDYEQASNLFRIDRIRELALSPSGLRYLKIRSLSRKEQMQHVIDEHGVHVGNSTSKEWAKRLFESDIPTDAIDECIRQIFEIERSKRRRVEKKLLNELYKINSFEWGGLHQNSLEKTIVDSYVKKISSFKLLNNAIENELHNSMRAYVLASWYNHWSSIIIEDIFKDHPNVIPAVGLIKKIDFFIKDKPFDLKVTYLPEGYIKEKRKAQGLRPELTLMKKTCRNLEIPYEKTSSESLLIPDLWQKLGDHPKPAAKQLIQDLQDYRLFILDEAMQDSELLLRWLYENQGVRRFDASNRLFLILVDRHDFFSSWKLKRAQPLISHEVNEYLGETHDLGMELDFMWEGSKHTTETDVIFVVKNSSDSTHKTPSLRE